MLLSLGIATSMSHTCFFSTTMMSGMLCAKCLSVCILKSHSILTSSFCMTFLTLCSHHLSAAGIFYFLHCFHSIEATFYIALYCLSAQSCCRRRLNDQLLLFFLTQSALTIIGYLVNLSFEGICSQSLILSC